MNGNRAKGLGHTVMYHLFRIKQIRDWSLRMRALNGSKAKGLGYIGREICLGVANKGLRTRLESAP